MVYVIHTVAMNVGSSIQLGMTLNEPSEHVESRRARKPM